MSLSKYAHAVKVLTELEHTFRSSDKELADFHCWLRSLTFPSAPSAPEPSSAPLPPAPAVASSRDDKVKRKRIEISDSEEEQEEEQAASAELDEAEPPSVPHSRLQEVLTSGQTIEMEVVCDGYLNNSARPVKDVHYKQLAKFVGWSEDRQQVCVQWIYNKADMLFARDSLWGRNTAKIVDELGFGEWDRAIDENHANESWEGVVRWMVDISLPRWTLTLDADGQVPTLRRCDALIDSNQTSDVQRFLDADEDSRWTSSATGRRLWSLITQALVFGQNNERQTIEFARKHLFKRPCKEYDWLSPTILQPSIINNYLIRAERPIASFGECGLCHRMQNLTTLLGFDAERNECHNTQLSVGYDCCKRLVCVLRVLVITSNGGLGTIRTVEYAISQLEQLLSQSP